MALLIVSSALSQNAKVRSRLHLQPPLLRDADRVACAILGHCKSVAEVDGDSDRLGAPQVPENKLFGIAQEKTFEVESPLHLTRPENFLGSTVT